MNPRGPPFPDLRAFDGRTLAGAVGQRRSDFVGFLVATAMSAYLVANRLIPDVFVLPVGLSIRLWEPFLALAAVAWFLWLIVQPKPFPRGALGLIALILLVVLVLAYFWNAPTYDEFEAQASRRGVLRVVLYGALFLISYHLALDLARGRRLLSLVAGLTAIQGVIGIFEFATGQRAVFLYHFWTGIGLIEDPKGVRGFNPSLRERLTGEIRAESTAPHPVTFSAVLAAGVLITLVLWLHAPTRRRRRLYGALLIPQLIALPLTSSRTGFVVLVVVGVALIVLQVRKWPAGLPLALGLTVVMLVTFVAVPSSARLLLNSFTRPLEDRNLHSRVADFDELPDLMADRPVIGAGYLTHDVSIIVFDNAYNTALWELGVVGFLLLVGFFLVCTGRSLKGLARGEPEETPVILMGVVGGLGLLAGGATFDAWTFDQF
ncbi:MAG: O-antigen ligase family protein, partial [Acidimicrobiia bacterium]